MTMLYWDSTYPRINAHFFSKTVQHSTMVTVYTINTVGQAKKIFLKENFTETPQKPCFKAQMHPSRQIFKLFFENRLTHCNT
jgi:hypothetical protein